MTYGYGRGSGFRGASPEWPYIGRGRGGLPRCWHSSFYGGGAYPTQTSQWSIPTGDQEIGFLKNQADAMKQQLEEINSRIKVLEEKN